MRGGQRDLLLRMFFIRRGEDQKPQRAGQIKHKTPEGTYVVSVTYDTPNGPHGALVTQKQITEEHWDLYNDEGTWRDAFVSTARQSSSIN